MVQTNLHLLIFCERMEDKATLNVKNEPCLPASEDREK
jgi:hypothetical protein